MAVLSVGAFVLIGAFLMASGVVKAREGQDIVRASVSAYRIGSQRATNVAAWLLPRAEIGIGLLLASTVNPVVGGTAAIALLLVYSIAMSSVLLRGMTTSCGCHGSLSTSEVRLALIVRNTVLIGAIAAASSFRSDHMPVNGGLALASATIATLVALAGVEILRRTATRARPSSQKVGSHV